MTQQILILHISRLSLEIGWPPCRVRRNSTTRKMKKWKRQNNYWCHVKLCPFFQYCKQGRFQTFSVKGEKRTRETGIFILLSHRDLCKYKYNNCTGICALVPASFWHLIYINFLQIFFFSDKFSLKLVLI